MKVLCADHIDVAVPVEDAFSFVSDISRWPVWISSVVCAQHPESRPLAQDEHIVLCLHAGRKRWQETFEVTRFLQNAFLSLEGEFSAARRIDFRFERRGSVTRIAWANGYPLFGGILTHWIDGAFHRRRVRRELKDSLIRLKGLLEERVESTALEDGYFYEPGADAVPAPSSTPMRQPAGVI